MNTKPMVEAARELMFRTSHVSIRAARHYKLVVNTHPNSDTGDLITGMLLVVRAVPHVLVSLSTLAGLQARAPLLADDASLSVACAALNELSAMVGLPREFTLPKDWLGPRKYDFAQVEMVRSPLHYNNLGMLPGEFVTLLGPLGALAATVGIKP